MTCPCCAARGRGQRGSFSLLQQRTLVRLVSDSHTSAKETITLLYHVRLLFT